MYSAPQNPSFSYKSCQLYMKENAQFLFVLKTEHLN